MYYCFSFEEIAETCVPKGSAVQLVLTSGVRFLLYSHRANQIHSMIEKYCLDNEKVGRKLYYFIWLYSGLISLNVNGLGKSAMHSQVLSSFNSTSCVPSQLNLSLVLLRVLREANTTTLGWGSFHMSLVWSGSLETPKSQTQRPKKEIFLNVRSTVKAPISSTGWSRRVCLPGSGLRSLIYFTVPWTGSAQHWF
jgi:hypothetical protein